jgi:hypothetical protein
MIRNLHPTTPIELIKSELEIRLFEVRQVSSVLHKINEIPLGTSIFYYLKIFIFGALDVLFSNGNNSTYEIRFSRVQEFLYEVFFNYVLQSNHNPSAEARIESLVICG